MDPRAFLFPPPSALHFSQLPKVDHGLAGSFGPGLQAGRVAHAAAYIQHMMQLF